MSEQPLIYTRKATSILSVLEADCHVSPADPPGEAVTFTGVWDTGASATAVSENVVRSCGLKEHGYATVRTAAGKFRRQVYYINFTLADSGISLGPLRATLATLEEGTDILIGMDVVSKGDLAISNARETTVLSFRVPARDHVVFEHDTRTPAQRLITMPCKDCGGYPAAKVCKCGTA